MIKLLTILLFNLNSFGEGICISKDTIISGVMDCSNLVLTFENGSKIKGPCTIKNAIISASIYQELFDISVSLQGIRAEVFSTCWFGANPNKPDNSAAFQKSIDVCISNKIRKCFTPGGLYNFSQSLKIFNLYNNQYVAASLRFYGESEMWDEGTILNYNGMTGFAIGGQYLKGAEIDHLTIKGQFTSPSATGPGYYNLPVESFGPSMPDYYGLCIDYDGSKNVGGSTGVKVHDMNITGFTVLYSVSPNGITSNADILLFENIRCGDGRIGFQSGQAQEKGNIIRGIYSWGKLHTLISIGQSGKYQSGNYTIDGGNISGACISLFDIRQSGWYPSFISNIFAESIATIGFISTGDSKNTPPVSVRDCVFHFALQSMAGIQTLLTSNSNYIKFSNCLFRYYGSTDNMNFSGLATYENCFFSGIFNNSTPGSLFLNYKPSTYQILSKSGIK